MAIKSNAAKREAGKVSAKKRTEATVKPLQFTEADWAAVYERMRKNGLFPSCFTEGDDGARGVILIPFGMYIPIPKPTFWKFHKPNA